ncbi:MAG: glycosyltransferase family 4 protein [Coleofasciculus sp. G3-WIS-01]|uniref:glycosyltransferase family 4 protein n=1 Tax=Coleofasciculus sp. G3-WIS-01 TaxID=3069528 RepID=UPI0033034FB7
MKILLLSTWDKQGGASRAAYLTHQTFNQAGIDSRMVVLEKWSDDQSVVGLQPLKYSQKIIKETRLYLDEIKLKPYYSKNRKRELFSPAISTEPIVPLVKQINPDIINLHWICKGFLNPEILIQFDQPIVWTLHDMWPFTGGCHFSEECFRYQERCGSCPHLGSTQENDLSRKLWLRKKRAWQSLNLTIVAVSHWLANCARQSSLFKGRRIEVIHNAIDTLQFKPIDREIARRILNLPSHKKIILFGAINATGDQRKGFRYLNAAIPKIAESELKENAELVIFGASHSSCNSDLGMKTTYLGTLHDNVTLSLVYSAADVMIVPSTQEAFGQTAAESLACGTPVVCFDTTGLKEVVDHQDNGYRAQCYSVDDLVKGIQWVLKDEDRWHKLSQRAREKIEKEFSMEMQAQTYLQLYQELNQDVSSHQFYE